MANIIEEFKDYFGIKCQTDLFKVCLSLLDKVDDDQPWNLKSIKEYLCSTWVIMQRKGEVLEGKKQDNPFILLDDDNNRECFYTGLKSKKDGKIFCLYKTDKSKHVIDGFKFIDEIGLDEGDLNSLKSLSKFYENIRPKQFDLRDIKLPEWNMKDNSQYKKLAKVFISKSLSLYFEKTDKELKEKIEEWISWKSSEDRDFCEKKSLFHILIEGADNLPKYIINELGMPKRMKFDEKLRYMVFNHKDETLQNKLKELGKEINDVIDDKKRDECLSTFIEAAGNKDSFKYQFAIFECLYRLFELTLKKSKNRFDDAANQIAHYCYIEKIGDGEDPYSYAFPLFFSHSKIADCVAIFNEDGKIRTLLKIDEVYGNVRVITEQEELDKIDWLK